MVHRRENVRRTIRRQINARAASEGLGPIMPGCEVFSVNKGLFNVIDVLAHLLDVAGPCHLALASWTAAAADIGFCYDLVRDGRILSMRFICDFSFGARQPSYLAALVEKFGPGCIRITKSHLKACVLTNESWNLVVRTSANLNENKRLEYLEVSDDAGLARFVLDIFDEVFRFQPAGAGIERRPIESCREFETLFEAAPEPVSDQVVMASTDVKKHFSDDLFGTDLRRAGVSFERGEL